MRNRIITAIAASALVFTACGGSDSGGASVQAPSPERRAAAANAAERKPEVSAAETPQACLDAMDLIEEGFGYASDSSEALSDGFFGAAEMDAAAIDQAAADMDAARRKTRALSAPLIDASSECRADDSAPASCTRALDTAADGFGIVSDVMASGAGGLEAASRFDVAGIDAARYEIEAHNERLGDLGPRLNLDKAACRE